MPYTSIMTAPPPPPPPARGGLSLYENLQDPKDAATTSATISSAPVLYNQPDETSADATAKKLVDPALRFQPIRRPLVKQTKPKPAFPKSTVAPKAVSTISAGIPPPAKSTLADWTATEEDEWRYGTGEKPQRGGRKKKKKKQQAQVETNWDELYDPARPTNVEEYLRSDEKVDEVREWKALLYRHRRKRDESDESDVSDNEMGDTRHAASSKYSCADHSGIADMSSDQFAPPSSYAFVAPPPRSPSVPPAPPSDTQRLATSQDPQPPPPPPVSPPTDSATISRAPIRYTQATETSNDQTDEAESPPPTLGGGSDEPSSNAETRSSRPGQAGFAHRLMSKYGWTKGTGLGADESGIINPLRVQVEKRRKKADADGGGWAEPGSKGKIIGGKRKEEDTGKFGSMSEVILLQNMLEDMPNLEEEIAEGLGQEIGEECGEKVIFHAESSRLKVVSILTQYTVWASRKTIHRAGQPQSVH